MWAVLDGESAQFDKDTYKILSKLAGKLQSLSGLIKTGE
jgi:hypothetical protein